MKGSRTTLGDALAGCPFRSLIGRGANADVLLQHVEFTVAVLGGSPEPLSPDMITEAVDVLHRGQTVLLISDRRDLRDFAKREILALAGPAGGRA